VLAINVYALPVIRYSSPVLMWPVSELQYLDCRTRKLLTMSRALHLRADVDRLCMPRSRGGRGLKSVEDVIKEEQCGVYEYLTHSEDPWLQVVLRAGLLNSPSFSNAQHFRSAMIEQRWSSFLDKPLHGHYFRVCHQIVGLPITFHWLTRGDFTLETEGFLTTLQDQAVTTRAMQHIFNSTLPSLCRLCGQHNETVYTTPVK